MKITNAEIHTLLGVIQEYDPPFVNFYDKTKANFLGDIHTDSLVLDSVTTEHKIFQWAAQHDILHNYETDIKRLKTLYRNMPEHMRKRLIQELTADDQNT